MRVTKEHGLTEVRRTAAENGGKPVGRGAFFNATGIRESDWIGKWWPRWNDVLAEAGFPPNQMNPRRPDDDMLQRLAELVRELGHYPVIAELKMKASADKTFPSPKTFDRFGGKRGVAATLSVVGSTNWRSSYRRKQRWCIRSRPMTRPASKATGTGALLTGGETASGSN